MFFYLVFFWFFLLVFFLLFLLLFCVGFECFGFYFYYLSSLPEVLIVYPFDLLPSHLLPVELLPPDFLPCGLLRSDLFLFRVIFFSVILPSYLLPSGLLPSGPLPCDLLLSDLLSSDLLSCDLLLSCSFLCFLLHFSRCWLLPTSLVVKTFSKDAPIFFSTSGQPKPKELKTKTNYFSQTAKLHTN